MIEKKISHLPKAPKAPSHPTPKKAVDFADGLSHEEEATIAAGLKAIYGEEETDFTKVERPKNWLTKMLLTLVLALSLIAVSVWGGFFLYTAYAPKNPAESYVITVEAPAELVSGELSTITIRYQNPSTTPLASLTIAARLPAGFKINSTQPESTNDERLEWTLGSLSAGSDGAINIEGVWISEVPSSANIQILSTYRPGNFNADFQDVKTLSVSSLKSSLSAEVVSPQEAVPGVSQTVTFKIKNNGEQAVGDVVAELALPTGFFLESSDPALATGASASWNLGVMEPKSEKTITVKGSFSADDEGFQYFDGKVSIKANDRLLTQTKAQGFSDVLGSTLAMNLVVGGESSAASAEQGSVLHTTLALENTGDQPLNDVSLLLDFTAPNGFPITWKEAKLDKGTLTKDGVSWGTSTIGILMPHEKRYWNLDLPIASGVTTQNDNFTVTAVATRSQLTVRSSPVKVVVLTEAKITATAKYVSGPLPPKVGETSVYEITWNLTNTLHDLTEVRVSALVPPGVAYKTGGSPTLGTINFDADSGTLSWNITAVPTAAKENHLTFQLEITPTENDIGKFIKLLSSTTIKAKDSVAGKMLERSVDGLDTDLPNDPAAAGKGSVEAAD